MDFSRCEAATGLEIGALEVESKPIKGADSLDRLELPLFALFIRDLP